MEAREWIGDVTRGISPAGLEGERLWHRHGARFFPPRPADLVDLPALFRTFVVDGHAPARPLLAATDRVVTFGSCFATHLRRVLVETGFAAETIHLGAGLNSTFALRDFLSWCVTGGQTAAGYRYERGPDGRIAEWQPEEERQEYLAHLRGAGALVFVAGLAEIWEDSTTGGVFWRGVPEHLFAAERHRYRVSTVAENVANLVAVIDLARQVNRSAPIVIALSPVPLNATFRPISCVTADCVSKSILRLAIDEVMARNLPNVYYWPSFEMVRWLGAHHPAPAFGDDRIVRHVADAWVRAIVDGFVAAYYPPEAHRAFRQRLAELPVPRGVAAQFDADRLGNVIDFADPWSAHRHCRQGWSYAEPGGLWTEGLSAMLSFALGPAAEDLEVVLEGAPFVAAGHPENGLRLRANGEEVAAWRFRAPAEGVARHAVLPRRLLAGGTGRLEIELVVDAPASPAEVGLSADARRLGFFVTSLVIRALGQAPPEPRGLRRALGRWRSRLRTALPRR